MKVPKIMKPDLLRATIGLVGLIILLTGTTAQAATLYVNTRDDESTGTQCSLREAVNAINQGFDGDGCVSDDPYGINDTINIPAYTIFLSAGKIQITNGVTIQGAGYKQTIIDGTNLGMMDSPIDIANNGQTSTVSISDLTIQNSPDTGVMVETNANLFLSYVHIMSTGNMFPQTGGCISINDGTVVLTSSELKDCKSSGDGGGIQFKGDANNNSSLTVGNTTIHECVSNGFGGGISLELGSSAAIYDSTLANNIAQHGAGLFKGEGVAATLQGVTIAYNENTLVPDSSPSSALFSSSQDMANRTDILTIQDSIVANNRTLDPQWQHEANCGFDFPGGSISPIVSGGFNILGNPGDDDCTQEAVTQGVPPVTRPPKCTASCANPNFITTGLSFAPADAGGVGPVYVLQPGSPGVSYVPSTDPFCATQDQRSLTRSKVGNSNCDIGAASRSSALFVFATSKNPMPGGPRVESPGDKVVATTLTNLGFDVKMADLTQTQVTGNNATGKAIVVVSKSTVNAGFNGTTFRDVPAGVLVMNRLIYGNMMMTGNGNGVDNGSTVGQTMLDMSSSQTLGSLIGYRGTVQVTNMPQTFGWGAPNPKMPPVITPLIEGSLVGNPNDWASFFYFAGQPMFQNFPAPGTRVGFFATQGASSDLTPAGSHLLEEAIIRAAVITIGD